MPDVSTAVELGIGNGRNLKYLDTCNVPKIYGIDFSSESIQLAKETLRKVPCEIIQANIVGTVPLESLSMDLIVDSYVSCHFVESHNFEAYLTEVERISSSRNGYFFWSGIGTEDEYYSKFTTNRIVTDPENDVTKKLYTHDEVKNAFGREYTTLESREIEFTDTVNSTDYTRNILTALYKI